MNEPGNGSVLPKGTVVGGAQSQVADQSNDRLDKWPARGRVHQTDDGGQAALETNRVLRHLALRVAGSQVAESANGWLCYLLPKRIIGVPDDTISLKGIPVSGCNNGPDESLDAANLANYYLVLLVVAGQVGQDTGSTGDDVYIVGTEQLHQALHQIIHVVLSENIVFIACHQSHILYSPTIFVPASERFLSVHKQF